MTPAFLALVLGGLSACVLLYSTVSLQDAAEQGGAMLFRRHEHVRQRFGRPNLCPRLLPRHRRPDLRRLHPRMRPSGRRHAHAGARRRVDEPQRAVDRERLLSLTVCPPDHGIGRRKSGLGRSSITKSQRLCLKPNGCSQSMTAGASSTDAATMRWTAGELFDVPRGGLAGGLVWELNGKRVDALGADHARLDDGQVIDRKRPKP